MTRQSFIFDVNDFDDLIIFCRENGCDICGDIYTENERADVIDERVSELAGIERWYNILSTLINITRGYEWYRRQGDDWDWEGLGEYDFANYKQRVLDWADNNAGQIFEDDDDDFVLEEPLSISELMESCSNHLANLTEATATFAEDMAEEAFSDSFW